MGGSLAKALRAYVPGVLLATLQRGDPDEEAAKEAGVLDQIFPTLAALTAWADLLFVATPLSWILPTCEAIQGSVKGRKKKLLVLDIGSVKGAMVQDFEKWSGEGVEFVLTHPMAGSEKVGFAASSEQLFQEATWILIPHEKNAPQTLDQVEGLMRQLGAKPMQMDAKTHDTQVAFISHFPALLSRLLLEFVRQESPESVKMAGPGFSSMTRLAQEPQERFDALVQYNKKNIQSCLEKWIRFLEKKI
jgi:prephenate dehydrogenase